MLISSIYIKILYLIHKIFVTFEDGSLLKDYFYGKVLQDVITWTDFILEFPLRITKIGELQ